MRFKIPLLRFRAPDSNPGGSKQYFRSTPFSMTTTPGYQDLRGEGLGPTLPQTNMETHVAPLKRYCGLHRALYGFPC